MGVGAGLYMCDVVKKVHVRYLISWWVLVLVWGTSANFNGFRFLAALLHGTPVLDISQTLRRWTEGTTYIRQGGHHVRHWPTFLVWLWFAGTSVGACHCEDFVGAKSHCLRGLAGGKWSIWITEKMLKFSVVLSARSPLQNRYADIKLWKSNVMSTTDLYLDWPMITLMSHLQTCWTYRIFRTISCDFFSKISR